MIILVTILQSWEANMAKNENLPGAVFQSEKKEYEQAKERISANEDLPARVPV